MSAISGISNNAFEQLWNLEERVRLSSASLPKTVDTREQWSGVMCHIAGKDFIVPLSAISEILEQKAVTFVPACADWLKGLLNLRGRLLPIFDVSEFLGTDDGKSSSYQVMVVEKDSVFCGIAVERIDGMQKFYQDDFNALDSCHEAEVGPVREFVSLVTEMEEKIWYQLDIFRLASRISQTSPASVADNTDVAA
ncbi:MAG: chemotaxis protein CheW [Pseudomonadales bacterium]|nr:chemotaxis protein CheW [Pseudomonadales bacterium]